MTKQLVNIGMVILFFFSLGAPVLAQSRLAVDINDPVYKLIEVAELKGILTKITQIKPYTRQDVYRFLTKMKAREYELSAQERKILDAYLVRFRPGFDPSTQLTNTLKNGSFTFGNQAGHAEIGLRVGAHFNFDVHQLHRHHASIPLEVYAQGDFLNSMFSYYINIILNTGQNSPYPFANHGQQVAMGMGFWQRYFGSPRQNEIWDTTEMPSWAQALEMTPEITGQFWDDRILLRMGMLKNREINTGLVLSREAASFAAVEFGIRPIEWFNFYYMTGALTGGRNTLGEREKDTEFHNNLMVQNSKMFSYHVGEFFISDYFYFNVWESVVWGSRMEAAYLIPVNVFLISQNLIGDHDNIAFGAGASTIVPKVAKLEANIMLDEFQGRELGTSPRNMFAWDIGLKMHIPWLPFSQFSFKYTNIGPYVYTHYPQNYAHYGTNTQGQKVLIDTGYTNRGKSLGSYLKPNSDEFKFTFDTMIIPGLSASLGYSLVRHGNSAPQKYWLGRDGRYYTDEEKNNGTFEDNFFDNGEVWAWDRNGITGELNGWLDYRQWDDQKWKRSFLKDAIYDWTNSFSLQVSYDLRFLPNRKNPDLAREIPIVVSLGYTFAHTFYDFNGRDFSHIDPSELGSAMAWAGRFGYSYKTTYKNIFNFSLSIYPK